jgi:Fic family protein
MMDRISKLYKEWLSIQPLKPEIQHRMDQQFMVDFNYNSNHLEGNTLTYGQTKLLLLFGKTEGEALFRDYEEMVVALAALFHFSYPYPPF